MDAIQNKEDSGISIQGEKINNLRFADDIDFIEGSCEALQESISILDKAGNMANMNINIENTKSMICGKKDIEKEIIIKEEIIENVT